MRTEANVDNRTFMCNLSAGHFVQNCFVVVAVVAIDDAYSCCFFMSNHSLILLFSSNPRRKREWEEQFLLLLLYTSFKTCDKYKYDACEVHSLDFNIFYFSFSFPNFFFFFFLLLLLHLWCLFMCECVNVCGTTSMIHPIRNIIPKIGMPQVLISTSTYVLNCIFFNGNSNNNKMHDTSFLLTFLLRAHHKWTNANTVFLPASKMCKMHLCYGTDANDDDNAMMNSCRLFNNMQFLTKKFSFSRRWDMEFSSIPADGKISENMQMCVVYGNAHRT